MDAMSFLVGSMLADAQTRKELRHQITETLTSHGVAEIAILMDDGSVNEFKSPEEIAHAVVQYLAEKTAEQQ